MLNRGSNAVHVAQRWKVKSTPMASYSDSSQPASAGTGGTWAFVGLSHKSKALAAPKSASKTAKTAKGGNTKTQANRRATRLLARPTGQQWVSAGLPAALVTRKADRKAERIAHLKRSKKRMLETKISRLYAEKPRPLFQP